MAENVTFEENKTYYIKIKRHNPFLLVCLTVRFIEEITHNVYCLHVVGQSRASNIFVHADDISKIEEVK